MGETRYPVSPIPLHGACHRHFALLELLWRQVAQCRVQPLPIVGLLQEPRNRQSALPFS